MSAENKEELDKIAQEKFSKDFDSCTPEERLSVGGTLGGERRKEQMSSEKGGDVSAAYSELGKKAHEEGGKQEGEEGK